MNSEVSKHLHKELIEHGIVQSCLNCENFNEDSEKCSLAPAFALPAKVVVYGCSKWIILIPF